MGFPRARRKKALVTACLTSFFIVCVLYDKSAEESVRKYSFYNGKYAKTRIHRQNQT